MITEMRQKTQWNGTYKGINWEVQTFDIGDRKTWTFYLYLYEEQFDPVYWKKYVWLRPNKHKWGGVANYDYYKSQFILGIDFHGGCTYYEKLGGLDKGRKSVKIGCDYGHYWDRPDSESVESVTRDVASAIDSLYNTYPQIKVWCCGNGGFYPPNEGRFLDSGKFYSAFYEAESENKRKMND